MSATSLPEQASDAVRFPGVHAVIQDDRGDDMFTIAMVTGGKENVLPRLATDQTWTKAPFKTQSVAADTLVNIAKTIATSYLTNLLTGELQDVYDAYVLVNEERTDDNASEWDAGLDDEVERVVEPYEKVLSADWLATHTIDTRLHVDGEIDRLANAFAAEVWRQLTYGRTTRQVLAGVGIVSADLDAIAPAEPASDEATTPEEEPMEYNPMAVNAILNKIILTLPDDEDQLREDLDFASGDDEGLAVGAMERLDITPAEASVLIEARKRSSAALDAWVNAVMAGEMLDEDKVYVDLSGPAPADDEEGIPPELQRNPDNTFVQPPTPPAPPPAPAGGPPPPPPVSTTAPPPAPAGAPPPPPVTQTTGAPKRGRGKKAEEAPATAIPQETLRNIKEASGMKDDELAAIIGVSRPSFNNMLNGKAWCDPPDDRRHALKQMMYDRITALTAAYQSL